MNTVEKSLGYGIRYRKIPGRCFPVTPVQLAAAALCRLMSRAGDTRNDLAMPRNDSPPACRISTNAMSTCAGRLLSRVPAFRVLASPALVPSEMVMRSCSASVAMMEMTTSRIIPQLSKNGSWKLRQPTPQSSSCWRCLSVFRTPSARQPISSEIVDNESFAHGHAGGSRAPPQSINGSQPKNFDEVSAVRTTAKWQLWCYSPSSRSATVLASDAGTVSTAGSNPVN